MKYVRYKHNTTYHNAADDVGDLDVERQGIELSDDSQHQPRLGPGPVDQGHQIARVAEMKS